MNPIIPTIRIATYLVGALIGINSQTPLGYLFAAPLVLNAIIVFMLEFNSQVLDNEYKATKKELDLIGFQLGIPRKEYSVAGIKVKELDKTYRKRMREYLKGVSTPRGL